MRAKPLQQPCENPSTGNSRAAVRNVRARPAPHNGTILKPHCTVGVSPNVALFRDFRDSFPTTIRMNTTPHVHRRGFFAATGAAGLHWLTPLGTTLARSAERERQPAKSVVVLWLGGGPSQLETFDPKPRTHNAARTKDPNTTPKGGPISTRPDP